MTRRIFVGLVGLVLAAAVTTAAPRASAQFYGGFLNVNTPVSGVFTPSLPIDASGKPYMDYQFVVSVPGTYQIDLMSTNTSYYDPYLTLMQNGMTIASNDDGAGALNSRISQFLAPGQYTVRVTRFGTGPISIPVAFSLSVTAAMMSAPPQVSYGTPLSESLARVLVTQYYNSYGEWAGQYAMTISRTRLVPTGPATVEVHVQYNYVCIRSYCAGARSGVDQRVFYFQRNGLQWQVVNMGGHMSAFF
jgi:hypothetical protein